MNNNDNATYLFEKPSRRFHSSESFWTSVFAIFLLNASQNLNISLPVYNYYEKYNEDGNCWDWKFKRKNADFIIPKNLCISDVIVEGSITKESFGLDKDVWNDLSYLKPDIIVKDYKSAQKKVYCFENKTYLTNIKEKDLYLDLKKYLEPEISTELYLIISVGNPHNSVFKNILDFEEKYRYELNIILWEDVLREIDINKDTTKIYLEEDLSIYYKSLQYLLDSESYNKYKKCSRN